MDNKKIKELRMHNISINPALNDGFNGLIRVEANQWIVDKNGNATDIKHRLEASDINEALGILIERAEHIMIMHVELKP